MVFAEPVPASSRARPLPQDYHRAEHCREPVGAGVPAKRPAQVYTAKKHKNPQPPWRTLAPLPCLRRPL
ncbi:hypothetical protein CXG50_19960 [Pseudomonas plecoglossicida]|nr:hypothetical protein CX682_23300 [Pseudomonas sp. FFUP_PS_41]PLU97333.1 hypothetical protein CXG52_14500 [Pseudomonas plecoglossicida]PLV06441.1 hypothetical protein CXG50_19960 [Pseudomonas plecoglossicida]